MELKDGSGSDSFSPSIWSLRQFIWFGLDLLLSSGSLWLWLAGRSSQRGSAYSSLQQNFHYVLPWWGSPWGIEAAFGLSGFAILWKMFCYSQ
ncbi:transmembrane protein [Arabidopsis thaliana]|uniref:Transmembrane protein n=1 Tax=Arabidopsis thaliana TaxID=3702 RepID=Q6DSS5_ARATH|nr:uncharacterized protein AT2G10608 [Arabidopsis thaliana]AAT68734.1 hypothetical protein At2g10608 [Arabidopsis thaliana]AEC06153.1 transmembrane protein [Arabidopsis thaliana]|eukprot:NP_001189522.1 transmembrane protein [Arabidopsis thaliana]